MEEQPTETIKQRKLALEQETETVIQQTKPPGAFTRIWRRNYDDFMFTASLPDFFCHTCTLREGMFISLAVLQTMTVTFVTVVSLLLVYKDKEVDLYWYLKFKNDFDYYIFDENMDLIYFLHSLWKPITYAVIGVEVFYFCMGIYCFIILLKKTLHPYWYLPWIITTGILVAMELLIGFIMIIVTIILSRYRDISVTWDCVPIAFELLWGVIWSYGLKIGCSFYRRRMIVHYWKTRKANLKNDDF